MIELTLPDMTCGGCAGAVTRTMQGLDPNAKVDVDLATKQVRIQTRADQADVVKALAGAGFPPA